MTLWIIWLATLIVAYFAGTYHKPRHRKPRKAREEEPSQLLADDPFPQVPLAQDFDFPRCHSCGSWYVTIADMDVPGRYWCGDHGYVPEEESPTLPMMMTDDLMTRFSDFLSGDMLSAAFA